MIYDKDGDKDLEAWSNLNSDIFPAELTKTLDDNHDLLAVVFNVYPKIKRIMPKALHKLMWKQFPVFRTETRPLILKFINNIADITANCLFLIQCFHLVHGQQTGVNVREKYPHIDSYLDFYARPQKPYTIDESKRHVYTWLSDEEWIEYRDTENKALLQFFNWKEKRKSEFINVVQNIYFKQYKELQDLNSDEWILYAVIIREEYESYLDSCEHIELVIDCGFPDEEMKLTDKEFNERYSALSPETRKRVSELRERRIQGEEI